MVSLFNSELEGLNTIPKLASSKAQGLLSE